MIASKMQIGCSILLTHSTLVGILMQQWYWRPRYHGKMFSSRRVVLYPEYLRLNKGSGKYINQEGGDIDVRINRYNRKTARNR